MMAVSTHLGMPLGMTLLGFKSTASLRREHNIRKSDFMYATLRFLFSTWLIGWAVGIQCRMHNHEDVSNPTQLPGREPRRGQHAAVHRHPAPMPGQEYGAILHPRAQAGRNAAVRVPYPPGTYTNILPGVDTRLRHSDVGAHHIASQDEALDEVTGDVSQSPGFHVIYLPFANDVRAPHVEPVGPDARMCHMLPLMTQYVVFVVSFLVLILSERPGCRAS
jgi:hypothetical protein